MVVICDPSLRDLAGFRRGAHYKARRGGHGHGAGRARRHAGRARDPRAPGHGGGGRRRRRPMGSHLRGPARGGGPRRTGRARQPSLRHRHAPDTAVLRERAARRRALARAQPQAAGRRRARGPPERRQVLPAGPSHPRQAQGGRLSLHHGGARAGHDRGRRPPARARRHPRADRGSQRRCGPGSRVSRPRGAVPSPGARSGPEPGGRVRPGGQPRDRGGRAPRARSRPGRAAPAPVPLEARPRARGADRGRDRGVARAAWGARCWPPPPPPGAGLEELAAAITWRVPLEDAPATGLRARYRPPTVSTGRARRIRSPSSAPRRGPTPCTASGWSG